MDRLVVFLEPTKTGEKDALGVPVAGEDAEHRVWCRRVDGTGSEGYTAEQAVGGRWERAYECWAEAFPPGKRPTERWKLRADDGESMRIRVVREVESGPYPVLLEVRAYRSTSG